MASAHLGTKNNLQYQFVSGMYSDPANKSRCSKLFNFTEYKTNNGSNYKICWKRRKPKPADFRNFKNQSVCPKIGLLDVPARISLSKPPRIQTKKEMNLQKDPDLISQFKTIPKIGYNPYFRLTVKILYFWDLQTFARLGCPQAVSNRFAMM